MKPCAHIFQKINLINNLYYRYFYYQDIEETKKLVSFYKNILNENDIVFDVGANIGKKTYVFSLLCRQVIAIEPQPFCIRILHQRFDKYSNLIKICPLAISPQQEQASLYIATQHTMSSMSPDFIHHVQSTWSFSPRWRKKITVKTTTLDALIENYGYPKYIKMDVEGYEENVLKTLSVPVPWLSFEFTPTLYENTLRCINRLESLSTYLYNISIEETYQWYLPHFVSAQEMQTIITNELYALGKFGDIFAQVNPSS